MKHPVLRFVVIATLCIGIIVAPFLSVYFAYSPQIAYIVTQCVLLITLVVVAFKSGKKDGKGKTLSKEDLALNTLFMVVKVYEPGLYAIAPCNEGSQLENLRPEETRSVWMLFDLKAGTKFVVAKKTTKVTGVKEKATPTIQNILTIPA